MIVGRTIFFLILFGLVFVSGFLISLLSVFGRGLSMLPTRTHDRIDPPDVAVTQHLLQYPHIKAHGIHCV